MLSSPPLRCQNGFARSAQHPTHTVPLHVARQWKTHGAEAETLPHFPFNQAQRQLGIVKSPARSSWRRQQPPSCTLLAWLLQAKDASCCGSLLPPAPCSCISVSAGPISISGHMQTALPQHFTPARPASIGTAFPAAGMLHRGEHFAPKG